MTQTNPLIQPISDTDVAKQKRQPSNPLIDAAHGKPHRTKLNPMIAEPKPVRNPLIPITEQPKDPSNLEAFANVLELPKSSVLDTIAGENPLDQWATPTQSINRTTGKQLLQKYDVLDDNDSWQNAVAGFAVDVALDPLTYTGLGTLSKGGKALSKAGLLKGQIDNLTDATTKTARQLINEADDATDAMRAFESAGGKAEHLDEPIKRVISFAGTDLARPLAPAIDAASDAIKASAPMRHLRSMFDPKVMNTTSQTAQAIAERSDALNDAIVAVGSKFAEPVRNNDIVGARQILSDIVKEAEASGLELTRFASHVDAQDVSQALANSEHLTKASAMAHASHELLGTAAKTDGTGVPLADALKRLGIDTDASRKAVSDWAGGRPIESLRIDERLLDDASRMISPFTDPETISGVRKAVENFTRLFKAHVVLPFPGFHFRNLVGGQMQNVILGANRVQDLADDLASAWKLRRGKNPKNLSSSIPDYHGLTDEQAAQRLREEIFARNLVGDWQPGAADVGKIKPDAASRMPGANPLLEKTKPTITESLNPMDPSKFAPTRIGGDVASVVEDMNRLGGYVGLRRLGYSPDEAAKRILALQGDYNSATQFENSVARNVIPFYQFSKAMLGLTADELMHRPGGRLGIAIKASAATDRGSSKPRNEASIQIGDTRYSGAGEMWKDSVDALGALAKGDVQSLGKQFGNKLNPLLKFPLEQIAQRDLHSGRPLDKMSPAVEQLLGVPIGPTAEHVARNSPFARYLSETQRLQKKREAGLLKFTTGINSNE